MGLIYDLEEKKKEEKKRIHNGEKKGWKAA